MTHLLNKCLTRQWTKSIPYHVASVKCSSARLSKEIETDLAKLKKKNSESSKKTTIKDSKGKEIGSLYAARITNKHYYGPLVESNRKKKSRQNRELKELKESSFTQIPPVLNKLDVPAKLKSNYDFDSADYERFATVYSTPPARYNDINTVKDVAEYSSKNITFPEEGKNLFKMGTTKILHLKSRMKNRSSLPSSSDSVNHLSESNIKSKNLKLIEIDNSKYTDVPRMLDITSIDSFPLLNLKLESSLVENSEKLPLEEVDSNKAEDGITSISYGSSGVRKVPSVSKILSDTMPEASRIALAKWEAKMIAELGEQGFLDYKKELFAQGSLLHECIHSKLQHATLPSAEHRATLGGHWTSIEGVVEEVAQTGGVMALESRVIHPHLHYMGIVDCVAVYRNTAMVVEWKTSSRAKKSLDATYDNPLQVAAYLGALQYDPCYNGRLQQVQSGLLAFSYSFGTSGHTHVLTPAQLNLYWQKWLGRLVTFWKMHSVTSATVS